MKIEVKHLLSRPIGSTESYPIEITDLLVDEVKATATGEVTLTNIGNIILVQIIGQAKLIQPCSRCLKEVGLTIPLNFSREFAIRHPESSNFTKSRFISESPSNSDNALKRAWIDEKESYPIEDGKIDLTVPLTEEIITSIPLKPLCQENCQGLCPQCGTNLNENHCKCDKVNNEISNKINL